MTIATRLSLLIAVASVGAWTAHAQDFTEECPARLISDTLIHPHDDCTIWNMPGQTEGRVIVTQPRHNTSNDALIFCEDAGPEVTETQTFCVPFVDVPEWHTPEWEGPEGPDDDTGGPDEGY